MTTTNTAVTTSSMTSPSGLRLERLSRRVRGLTLLDQLSLEVAPGEILALLGPSGCGKSTSLRLIAGLDAASDGQVWLQNREITALAPAQRNVAMVFQSYALYPHLTVERNLSLGLEIRGVPAPRIAAELDPVLELLQLSSLRRRRPAELSGGQRQRVALARALLRRPALFLLDEPMSNLDAQLREDLRAELRRLLRSTGAPVVYVTHDQHEAMGLADRIAVLKAGQLQQLGTAQELYRQPVNRFVAAFLGSPSINLIDRPDGSQLGLRPEQLELAAADAPLPDGWRALEARIRHREWLGDRVITHLDCHGGISLKALGATLPGDEPVQVRWRQDQALRFDQASGRRLPGPAIPI